MFNGNSNNRPGPAGNSGMVLSELKMLKERNKALEADNKKLRASQVVSSQPTISVQEHHRVRMALLNLLVAVENLALKPKKDGEMDKALKGAENIIRPPAPAPAAMVATQVVAVPS